MEELIRVFSRTRLSEFQDPIDSNTIYCPGILWAHTKVICDGPNEKAGWLLCSKSFRGDFVAYLIECVYVAFDGGSASVFPDKRLRMQDPEHTAIEFHIHPKALGSQWHDKFSPGDKATLRKRMDENISYKHVLFTPTSVLTVGKERPGFQLASHSPDIDKEVLARRDYWKERIDRSIAKFEKTTGDVPLI